MFDSVRPRRPALTLSLLAFTAAIPTAALSAEETVAFAIPAGSLDSALKRFAAATHQQILYAAPSVAGRTVPALSGRYAPDAALRRLLQDSGLVAERAGPAVLVLKPRGQAVAGPRETAGGAAVAKVRWPGGVGRQAPRA